MNNHVIGINVHYPYINCIVICVETGEMTLLTESFGLSKLSEMNAVRDLVQRLEEFNIGAVVICSHFEIINSYLEYAIMGHSNEGFPVLNTDCISNRLNQMLEYMNLPRVSLNNITFHSDVVHTLTPDVSIPTDKSVTVATCAAYLACKAYCEAS